MTGAATTVLLSASTGAIDVTAATLETGAVISGTSTTLATTGAMTTGAIGAGTSLAASSTSGPMGLGAITTGTTATLDTTGALSTGGTVAGGALMVGGSAAPASIVFGGNVSAESVALTTPGALAGQGITGTGGAVGLAAGSLDTGAIEAATNLAITSGGAAITGDLTATSGTLGVTATTLDAGAVISGTSSTLDTTGAMTTGAIDAGTSLVASSINGPMSLGAITTQGAVTLNTAGTLATGGIASDGALLVGNAAAPASVTFIGDVVANAITVNTTGLVSALGLDSGAQGEITLRSRDLQLGGLARANRVALIVDGAATTVGLGSASGDYALSDAELGRITTPNLSLAASSRDIAIGGVNFVAGTGSEAIRITGAGAIRVTGDVTMAGGAARSLSLGDDTTRLIAINTNDATVNVGGAMLVLTAQDILAGTPGFLTLAEGRESADLAAALVNDPASALYDPDLSGGLSAKRSADPAYLNAGSLRLRFANTALFQNSAAGGEGSGLVLGTGPDSLGTLTLETRDTSNAFAIFGTINGLGGIDAATAGPTMIVIDDTTLEIANARVNGCVLGSGEGCGQSDTSAPVILDLRSEARVLLNTGRAASQPFDPLSQTQWEGLLEPVENEEATAE